MDFKTIQRLGNLSKTVFNFNFLNFFNRPFTTQRVCELLMNPEKNHVRLERFFVTLQKLLNVNSTVDCLPFPKDETTTTAPEDSMMEIEVE
jgi:hypothetical protein